MANSVNHQNLMQNPCSCTAVVSQMTARHILPTFVGKCTQVEWCQGSVVHFIFWFPELLKYSLLKSVRTQVWYNLTIFTRSEDLSPQHVNKNDQGLLWNPYICTRARWTHKRPTPEKSASAATLLKSLSFSIWSRLQPHQIDGRGYWVGNTKPPLNAMECKVQRQICLHLPLHVTLYVQSCQR